MLRAAARNARIAAHVGAAVVVVGATVLMTWPLALHASDHVLEAVYYWDAYTNTMILGGHVDAVLGRGPLSLYDDYFFAPLPKSIVFNENLFGLSLLYAPFYLATGNPLLAYNLTLLLSLSLSAFFTYLLVRRLTGSGPAGVLAGVTFALSPYVTFEIGRLQLVATQWIPACFLLLHRAIEERKLRDVFGLWLCYLLQVGTCLYYAMFLIPLLALHGGALLWRARRPLQVSTRLVAVGAVAAIGAFAMVRPYFEARGSFDLGRTIAFASIYDGKLGFFLHVHNTNHTLSAMHHASAMSGGHEEIAFPGFAVVSMVLLSFGVSIGNAIRTAGPRWAAARTGFWLIAFLAALAASLLTHSMIFGAAVILLSAWRDARRGEQKPFSGRHGPYVAILLLSVALFLGLSPIVWRGAPVRGLYYYLHAYFPGFDGIRKVSRQAVMTTFAMVVLSGFGSAWLLSRLSSRPWLRAVVASALLCGSLYELRTFPHPLKEIWAEANVPEAYRFLATLPPHDLIASVPQGEGRRRFRGDAGRMLHDYLALYHKHRIVTGQSTWIPPVTDLVLAALRHLPEDGARRILESVGTRHILVHGEDLDPSGHDLAQTLAGMPQHYRQVFRQGTDSVFTLEGREDPSLTLLDTPALPRGATVVAASELRTRASHRTELARNATDGDLDTYWSSGRRQTPGQYFELALKDPRRLVALEIDSRGHVTHGPLSFRLETAVGNDNWQTLVDQPVLRLAREQVYSPRTFVLRLVFPAPTLADRLRITIAQPVPDHDFVIHELRVYADGALP